MKISHLLLACLLLASTACRSSLVTDLAAGSGQSLFQDEFSDPSGGWPEVTGMDGSMNYVKGTYQVRVDRTEYELWAFPGHSYGDVRIEVDATRLVGPLSNRFGLICRARDHENFYFFIISSDGYYAIGKVEAGVRSLIGQEMMAYTTAIDLESNVNHLRFECIDQILTGSINGQVVAITMDESIGSGDTGLLVGTFDEPGVMIAFDHFVVYKP